MYKFYNVGLTSVGQKDWNNTSTVHTSKLQKNSATQKWKKKFIIQESMKQKEIDLQTILRSFKKIIFNSRIHRWVVNGCAFLHYFAKVSFSPPPDSLLLRTSSACYLLLFFCLVLSFLSSHSTLLLPCDPPLSRCNLYYLSSASAACAVVWQLTWHSDLADVVRSAAIPSLSFFLSLHFFTLVCLFYPR